VSRRELVDRTITVMALVALGWVVAWFVRQVTEILLLLLVSAILATGLAPSVGLLERWRLPGGTRLSRGVAIFVLYLALFAIIGGILSVIIVPAVAEARGFVERLPDLLVRLRDWLQLVREKYPWLPDLAAAVNRLPQQLASVSRYGSAAAGVAFRFLSGITAVITVLVFTFYMLLEGAEIKRAFLALFPPGERDRVSRVLERIGVKFGGWLRGQLLLSFTIAAIVTLGLSLLRIPYPFLLGIVAGVGELIPMVGPSLGAAVAILVALSQQLWQLVGTIAFYTLVMNVEPHFLVPRIMARVVGLSPLLTLVALLAGIKLMGILGGLLAVPVAAALQVIASEIAQEIMQSGTN
jgi:predicted PurR-regulated permease PerM